MTDDRLFLRYIGTKGPEKFPENRKIYVLTTVENQVPIKGC